MEKTPLHQTFIKLANDEAAPAPEEKKKQLRASRDHLIAGLRNKLVGFEDVVGAGSYYKRLDVGKVDFDLLVVVSPGHWRSELLHDPTGQPFVPSKWRLLDSNGEDIKASTWLQKLRNAVNAIGIYVERAHVTRPSVTHRVKSKSLDFDLLPALECNVTIDSKATSAHLIPCSSDPDCWSLSYTKHDRENIMQLKRDFPFFTEAVRVCKWFRLRYNWRFSSSVIETIAALIIRSSNWRGDLGFDVPAILSKLSGALRGGHLQHRWNSGEDLLGAQFPEIAASIDAVLAEYRRLSPAS